MGMADLHTRPAGEYFSVATAAFDSPLSRPIRAVYVGGSGDLEVVDLTDSTSTFVGLSAGVLHPLAFKQINSAGTTATDIVVVVR